MCLLTVQEVAQQDEHSCAAVAAAAGTVLQSRSSCKPEAVVSNRQMDPLFQVQAKGVLSCQAYCRRRIVHL